MKNGNQTPIVIAATVLLITGVVVWVSLQSKKYPNAKALAQGIEDRTLNTDLVGNRAARNRDKQAGEDDLLGEDHPLALKDERLMRFSNEDAYRKFLASMKDRGLKLLGSSSALRAVRFGYGPGSDLNDIEDAEISPNYIVSIPLPPQNGQAQAGAVGFGQNALSWLGVKGDNSLWGKGVTVAVLDSGVNEHLAFGDGKGKITRVTLTDLPEGTEQLGHGTAVASIITGDHAQTPGLAPAADVLSIRITDESGSSDSFTLAEGIVQAADSGAQVINISMGSQGNSPVVADAVRYAQEKGAVIVASTGNEGIESVAYPAAYDGVIGVGAVEANGQHLDFSNSGDGVGVAAPGYEVNAAWGDDKLTAFSGTSASAPFVSGAIAAAMSENPDLTSQQAADLVLSQSNDAGFPGTDSEFGSGVLDMGRVMEHGTPGIYDAAIASQILVQPEDPTSLPHVWVTVQNQGTETMLNSPLSVNIPTGTQQINISSLAPGEIKTYKFPVALPFDGSPVNVQSSVQSTEGDNDEANNSQSVQFFRTPEE